MRTLKLIILAAIAFGMNISCSAQSEKVEKTANITNTNNIEVYYFHYTRRCATCNAVENVSKEAITELYGNKVTFTSFNLDEAKGKNKGKELEVSGQTLLIVAGDTKINITNEGFMNARNNPEKLKEIIKEKIDGMME